MTMETTCSNGHDFMCPDVISDDYPKDAPICPACYLTWAENNDLPITPEMQLRSFNVIDNTKKRKERVKMKENYDKVMGEHRKTHEEMDSVFCPECGERLKF